MICLSLRASTSSSLPRKVNSEHREAMTSTPPYERWVWTELLGFDANQPDCGVRQYLETLNFIPDVVSLLIAAPDMILQHADLDSDALLPADYCARDGHDGNEIRPRQEWTRFQVRDLVARLKDAGCQVYLSNFTHYLDDKFHREWLSDHPECKITWATHGKRDALFVLSRMADGSYFQDFFAAQLVQVCLDYGFDGWHGPDGYGPSSPIFVAGWDDDFFGQFITRGQEGIPASITTPALDQPEKLQARMDWVWRHRRLEWIEFYSDRWAEFWQTVTTSLHAIGRRTVINSAWTRDPFEAKYRYGIDYRKIVDTGVDAIMVETAAGGILLGSKDRDYHYDYLAMLLLIKAYVPDAKLIFLHNIKDVAEDWDLLRHAPAMLEREVYALANVFHLSHSGRIERCVDGFLACLADGISREEWTRLAQVWEMAFEGNPYKVPGAKVLWSDDSLHNYLAEFPTQRDASAHLLTYRLMEQNAPLQMTVPIGSMELTEGPFLIFNPHLLPEDARLRVIQSPETIILVGPDLAGWPTGSHEIQDGDAQRCMKIRVYGSDPLVKAPGVELTNDESAPALPQDPLTIAEPLRFRAMMMYRPVSEEFFQAAAELIRRVCGGIVVENQQPANLQVLPPLRIGVMITEQPTGFLRVAVKNSADVYGRPTIDLAQPIQSIKVRSGFPVTQIKPRGHKFDLVVPQCGVVVADVRLEPENTPSSISSH